MIPLPDHWMQVLVLGVACGAVGVVLGREVRRRWAGDQWEQDQMLAELAQQQMQREGRVRPVVSAKPEWWKRTERRLAGLKRLGEQKRATLNGAE